MSPPTKSLPSPVSNASSPRQAAKPSCFSSAGVATPSVRLKYFQAAIISSTCEPPAESSSRQCPPWSSWAASQFTFDYLFTLMTCSTTPELFIRQYHQEYIDVLFKLEKVICAMGTMSDGAPPPSFFQSFYYLKRLFPRGFISLQDFTGQVGTTTLLRLFSTGITVANLAIFEQRNRNLEWEEMCGIPDYFVDTFEDEALAALNGDLFDLSRDRDLYLDWLGHLGVFTESHHFRAAHSYLRTLANLIAYTRAPTSFLPLQDRARHVCPIHFSRLEKLASTLCLGTGVAPTLNLSAYLPQEMNSRSTPTAAGVLATVVAECDARLRHPLSVRPSWSQ
ncbi:hypothetical protein FB45DRAFT_1023343 [Roridomyces roridus]|uniref:Uncharacterized protein n=1 Tax=Roridomyces roridus TaxID=1738132 RepID=A0AAD7FUF2_9AGAR|nr:hypothetical protein FB45DRAFT_1023343 [Roridomyces roridus]